jgi:hypothetical protein
MISKNELAEDASMKGEERLDEISGRSSKKQTNATHSMMVSCPGQK